MKSRIALLLCLCLLLGSTGSLAASKNKDNLPIGNLAGFEGGSTWFGEDFAYDITDEAACWELLMQPITVLNADEKEPIYPLYSPNGEKVVYEWQGGFINGAQAGVHVLSEDEDGWTLIEGLDYYDRVIRGYVKTSLLKTVTPDTEYGIIIDKLTQKLYVFRNGKLWSSCSVSTGLANVNQPYNETATGEYILSSWVGGFDSEGMYCEMGIRFNGGDMLHQVPYTVYKDGTKNYTKYGSLLGRKASHGCVRVQRTANEDGLCISWIWENLHKGVKVVVWDDDGRTLGYPEDDTLLYYNPKGGSYYHAHANCSSIKSKYLPLSSFRYGELETGEYASLNPCPYCVPEKRKSVIDEVNQERVEIGLLLQNPVYTGEAVDGETVDGEAADDDAADDDAEENETQVTIVIR